MRIMKMIISLNNEIYDKLGNNVEKSEIYKL